jgi:hypothetical protein
MKRISTQNIDDISPYLKSKIIRTRNIITIISGDLRNDNSKNNKRRWNNNKRS